MKSHPPSLSAQGLGRVYICTFDLEHLCHMCHPSSPLVCKWLSFCGSRYRRPPAFLKAAVKASSMLELNLNTAKTEVVWLWSTSTLPTPLILTVANQHLSLIPSVSYLGKTMRRQQRWKQRAKQNSESIRGIWDTQSPGFLTLMVAHLTLRTRILTCSEDAQKSTTWPWSMLWWRAEEI